MRGSFSSLASASAVRYPRFSTHRMISSRDHSEANQWVLTAASRLPPAVESARASASASKTALENEEDEEAEDDDDDDDGDAAEAFAFALFLRNRWIAQKP